MNPTPHGAQDAHGNSSPLRTAAKSLRRRPALAILAAIPALLILSWLFRPKPATGNTAFALVGRGDFTVSIVEGGTLSAVNEVSIRNEVEGTARIIFIVPEGSYVKKGSLLIELDSAQAQDQVNQQQIAVEKAQFALIQSQAQLDIQRSTTNSDIRAAKLKLDFALLELEKFRRGQRVVDLIEASNKLVQAQEQLAVNLANYINTTNLAAKGYETQQKVDSDRLAVMGNQNSVIVASNQIWMLQEFDHRKRLAEVSSAVEEAQTELERVIAQSERRIAQYTADLITQSNTLSLSQRKLDRDRKNLDATKIHAPQDGLVVYNVSENRFSSESLIEEGATVRNRQELIKLPDVSRMKVTIKVHESYINMVTPGLPAFVTLDSTPDQRFAGHVAKVALLPDSQARWGNPNLKVYNTEIHITDPLPDVKPGVSAKAEVIITNIPNTLSVPIQAVTTTRGKQVVYTLKGRNPEPQPVEVGMYNTKFIQVLSGLAEGDRVLLAPPFDTDARDLEDTVLTDEERALLNGTNKANAANAAPSITPPSQNPAPTTPTTTADTANPLPDRRPRNPVPDDVLKRFDTDGDGSLSPEERSAMRPPGNSNSRTPRDPSDTRRPRNPEPTTAPATAPAPAPAAADPTH